MSYREKFLKIQVKSSFKHKSYKYQHCYVKKYLAYKNLFNLFMLPFSKGISWEQLSQDLKFTTEFHLALLLSAVPEQLSRKQQNPYFKLYLYKKEDCITSCKGHLGLILSSGQSKSKFFLAGIYDRAAVRGNHASCLHN